MLAGLETFVDIARFGEKTFDLTRRLDEMYTAWPFFGSCRMTVMLRAEGHDINRKRVQRLMRQMAIAALGAKPNTSKPAPGHKIYPYLLRDMKIDRPNQVWCTDITYGPIGRGFLYLVAVMDWNSRAVLSWRLSNVLGLDPRMDTSFRVEAREEALARFGKPEIFNTDNGSQFTSTAFVDVLLRNAVEISMDGRGRWMDNVFIERLWRSLEHEEMHLKTYADGREAKAGLSSWIKFCNSRRPHSALAHCMPIDVFRAGEKAVDMTDNACALTTSLRGPFHQALLDGTFDPLRPRHRQKTQLFAA